MPFSPKLIRLARRLLLSLAVGVTLLAGFYVVENWRGDRAWRVCVSRYAAQGDPVDALLAPSSLPAASNFMATPLLERLLFALDSRELKEFLDAAPPLVRVGPDWLSGCSFDLGKYAALEQAERKRRKLPELSAAPRASVAMLTILAPLEPALTDLGQALVTRRDSQAVRPRPITRDEPFKAPIAGFQLVRLLGHSLSIRASALQAEGRPVEALTDTLAGLRLARGFTDMPDAFLIEAMIGTVMTNIALQPVWEGVQSHAWNEAQLEKLQWELAQLKPLAALERALRLERAGFVLTLRSIPSRKLLEASPHSRFLWRLLAWGPRGWLKQNCVTGVAEFQIQLDFLAARGTPEFLPRRNAQLAAEKDRESARVSPYTLAVQEVIPAHEKISANVTVAEANVILAQTACALERHWLAHGKYPASLAELVPAYLDRVPLDVVNGQPLHYRRTENGKFVLYSVGLDGKDDGGKPTESKRPTDSPGDWIWPQPVESSAGS
jgi:hypothetical protein